MVLSRVRNLTYLVAIMLDIFILRIKTETIRVTDAAALKKIILISLGGEATDLMERSR